MFFRNFSKRRSGHKWACGVLKKMQKNPLIFAFLGNRATTGTRITYYYLELYYIA